jgi:hypothetical protein
MSFDEYRNAIEQAVNGVPQDELDYLSLQASDRSSDLPLTVGPSDDSFDVFQPDMPITYSNIPGAGAVASGAGAGAGAGQGGGGITYVPPPMIAPPSTPPTPTSQVSQVATPVLQQTSMSSKPFGDLLDGAFGAGASALPPAANSLVGGTIPIPTTNSNVPSGHLVSPAIPPTQINLPPGLYPYFLKNDLNKAAKANGYAGIIDFINGVKQKEIKSIVQKFLIEQGYSDSELKLLSRQMMFKLTQLRTGTYVSPSVSPVRPGAGPGSGPGAGAGVGAGVITRAAVAPAKKTRKKPRNKGKRRGKK